MAFQVEIIKTSAGTLVNLFDSKKPDIKEGYLYNEETDIVMDTRRNLVFIPAPKHSQGYKDIFFGLENLTGTWSSTNISELAIEFSTKKLFADG